MQGNLASLRKILIAASIFKNFLPGFHPVFQKSCGFCQEPEAQPNLPKDLCMAT